MKVRFEYLFIEPSREFQALGLQYAILCCVKFGIDLWYYNYDLKRYQNQVILYFAVKIDCSCEQDKIYMTQLEV